jgi:hypothetical protein
LRSEISALAEKLAEERVEEISPIVEQQINPESFENASYSVELSGYESASYSSSSYYDLVKGDYGISASTSNEVLAYEHEFLQSAQEIASNTREGDISNNPYVDTKLDTNKKYIKEDIKLFSPVLWLVMYEGKLTFN